MEARGSRLGASFGRQMSARLQSGDRLAAVHCPALMTRKGCTFVHTNSDASGRRPNPRC
jgi:hypothetical protein